VIDRPIRRCKPSCAQAAGKGAVRQVKTIGNALIFEAAITRKAAHRRLIDDLLEMFGGSARPLMSHLAETGKLTVEDVRQIDEMLSERAAKAESVVRPAPKVERQV
jgi:BlaI family transcriptional regulator, penicillinase repressor